MTGFDILDHKSFLSKQNFNKITSVGTFTSIVIAFVLTIIIGKMILRKSFDVAYFMACDAPCKVCHAVFRKILAGANTGLSRANFQDQVNEFTTRVVPANELPKISYLWRKHQNYGKVK